MAMMALPTAVHEFETAVHRRASMGMDAEVERRVQLALTSESARALIEARVIEGYQSESCRASLKSCIKPELMALETQTAVCIANVCTKIAEIQAMRVELDRRLGNSSEQLEAMGAAGNEAFQAQTTELDTTRRQTAEAGLAANTARFAEIQQAMTVAIKSLDRAAQVKTHVVVSQVDGHLRLIRESIAGASQGRGGGGYG